MPPANGNRARYVYGVVRAGAKPSSREKGIDGRPVRLIAAREVGALTTDVPDAELEAGRDELLAHSRVLERALARGVVLPMRFGVVMPSERSLREDLLDAHREDLASQLAEMDGKVELNVKGIYEEQAILREVIEENRDVARLRGAVRSQSEDATYYDRIQLGELVAEAMERKREADGQAIANRLAPQAVAVEAGEVVHERMAFNASFLLERSRLSAFDRALDRIAADHRGRIRFRAAGPLPPHSFVQLSMEA
jgi:hypothetical protein